MSSNSNIYMNLRINPSITHQNTSGNNVTWGSCNSGMVITPCSSMTPNTRYQTYGDCRNGKFGYGPSGWANFARLAGQGNK